MAAPPSLPDRRRRRRPAFPDRAAALLALALVLAGCATTTAPRPVTPLAVDAARTAALVSAFRAEHGLGPVALDTQLMQAAAAHARTMGERDTLSHDVGASLRRRAAAVDYRWRALAENLAAGSAGVDAALAGWKASPGHRANLLNPHVTEIGIAAVTSAPGASYRSYWALILGAPSGGSSIAVLSGGAGR